VSTGQVAVIRNSAGDVNFVLDRQPNKVALNAYTYALER
jgi:hypothetical protein